jgi:hypothetical protein
VGFSGMIHPMKTGYLNFFAAAKKPGFSRAVYIRAEKSA